MIERINVALPPGGRAGGATPKNIAEAATQFEALLIAQLLRSARESGAGAGWLGTGEDSTADSALQMAEEQFAASMAAQGGLGLARMIEQGLRSADRKS
jgi:Rod binding domain-containing protein